MKIREHNRVVKIAVMVAICLNADGCRECLYVQVSELPAFPPGHCISRR